MKDRDYLPFALPDIGQEEIDQVVDAMRSGWITMGPKVKQFEEQFAEYVGAKNAVAVNSCTAALHLALEAIGLQQGDEVLIPVTTFTATAEVITYFNATPVLVDIDPKTLNIDPESIRKALETHKKVKAIIPVHLGGLPCEMDEIQRIADSAGISVIEDAAHALSAFTGTGASKKMIGVIGDLTCFSFYATKTITTGEGGMVTTENDEWTDRMKIMRLHGISKDAWKRYTNEGSWYYEVIEPGFKYNMTDIAAGMGLAQLAKCEFMKDRRKEISQRYTSAFSDLQELVLPPSSEGHAWHLYVLRIRPETLNINRNQFIEELKQRNIGTSVHFIPLHYMPYCQRLFGYKKGDFPDSEWVYERCISLPIYPKMTDDDVQYVIDNVREMVQNHHR